jgi:hypothetical protein
MYGVRGDGRTRATRYGRRREHSAGRPEAAKASGDPLREPVVGVEPTTYRLQGGCSGH